MSDWIREPQLPGVRLHHMPRWMCVICCRLPNRVAPHFGSWEAEQNLQHVMGDESRMLDHWGSAAKGSQFILEPYASVIELAALGERLRVVLNIKKWSVFRQGNWYSSTNRLTLYNPDVLFHPMTCAELDALEAASSYRASTAEK